MRITYNSYLSLVPVEIRKDKRHFIVEDIATGDFYEMPEVCIAGIELIKNKQMLADVEMVLKERYPNEDIDILDFTEQLFESGLISAIDGVIVNKVEKEVQKLGYLWLPPKLGRLFFNKISFCIYFVLFLVDIFLFTSNPDLIPRYKDLFIFDLMTPNILIWLLISFILVLIHEFGHILAIRARELPTKLGIGHRLFFVVFETDMSTVWKIPSKDRITLFLAGLCFDVVVCSLSLIGQIIIFNDSGIYHSILNVIILDVFIRMIYQCCIYMKTDLYYVFENLTGSYNLMESAQELIKGIFLSKRSQEVIFENEKNTILFYSVFYFLGVTITLGLFLYFYIPQLVYTLKKVWPGLKEGPSSLFFWDSTLIYTQLFIIVIILVNSLKKKYLQA